MEYAKTGKKVSGYTDTGVTLIAAKAMAGVDSKDVKTGTDLCWGAKVRTVRKTLLASLLRLAVLPYCLRRSLARTASLSFASSSENAFSLSVTSSTRTEPPCPRPLPNYRPGHAGAVHAR